MYTKWNRFIKFVIDSLVILLSTFIYWVLIIMHGLPFRPLGQPQTGFLIFFRSTGQRSHRPHLRRFCYYNSLIHNTYMVLCTKFHDHGTQYRETNLYFQICINITGVLKLLDGTVRSQLDLLSALNALPLSYAVRPRNAHAQRCRGACTDYCVLLNVSTLSLERRAEDWRSS